MEKILDLFPSDPGTYTLILHAPSAAAIQAGALGRLVVESGWYLYIGSAFGPGGLRGRLSHHLNQRPAHWHIDALKPVAPIQEIWYTTYPHRLEHTLAQGCQVYPGMRVPWEGFGASDCRCMAHLFYSEAKPKCAAFKKRLRTLVPGQMMMELVVINKHYPQYNL